jgi:tetratricopeptide (TPR) repeat protein
VNKSFWARLNHLYRKLQIIDGTGMIASLKANAAITFEALGMMENAMKEIEAAISINSELSDVRTAYSILLLKLGRFIEARDEALAGINIDYLNDISYMILSRAYAG